MPKAPLQPLKRGDHGPEVATLYAYLRRLGYAPHSPRAVDHYDEPLADAVRRYQECFGLEADGETGERTLAQLRRPRCGVPDLLPGAAAVPRAVPTIRAWPRTDLTYGFMRHTEDLTPAQTASAVAQAFATWAAVTPLTFRHVPPPLAAAGAVHGLALAVRFGPAFDRAQARAVQALTRLYRVDVLVGFLVREHGDPPAFLGTPPFDDNAMVLGHAWPPPSATAPEPFAGDVHFNDAPTWTNRPGLLTDLQAAAVHEVGHALGLGHTRTDTDSVMTASGGDGRRELAAADVEAVQRLYGPARWPRDGAGGR
ncbi:matrixin family metalloprotease [Streptomyces globosus]|uniref:matrixin family metalloprotease n=1 Tax=Streptomyces globosus TaxID=68209 RepID=UPI0037F44E20